MKTAKKSILSLLLAAAVLFSAASVSSLTASADVKPGTLSLILSQTEDGFILDVFLLNMSEFDRCDLEISYNSEDLYFAKYEQRLTKEPVGYTWHECSYSDDYISADLTFHGSADLHLFRYYFEKRAELLLKGAVFEVNASTYFNETDSYTDSASVAVERESFDPEEYPDVHRSGDVNGDGGIDADDARTALRISVGLDKCFELVKKYADVDGDTAVSAADSRIILRRAVGLESDDVLSYFIDDVENGNNYWDRDVSYITLTEGKAKEISDVFIRKGQSVSWTSSNPEAVKVSKNGKITALKKGFSCVILESGNEKLYFEVTVKSELQQKIEKLKEKYPDGYYWNNHEPSKKYPLVSEIRCSDHEEGKYSMCKGQCAGFAELLFSEVFPNARRTKGITWENVKIGDYVRLKRHHSIFITDVVKKGDVTGYDYWSDENYTAQEDYVVVAHCNWYSCCNIQWDYIFYPSDSEMDPSYSYTAY